MLQCGSHRGDKEHEKIFNSLGCSYRKTMKPLFALLAQCEKSIRDHPCASVRKFLSQKSAGAQRRCTVLRGKPLNKENLCLLCWLSAKKHPCASVYICETLFLSQRSAHTKME